jgi:hypothetical protein
MEFVKIQENSDFNVKKRFNGSFTELFFLFCPSVINLLKPFCKRLFSKVISI